MMGLWDVCSLEIGECEMLGIWMFEMWGAGDVGCLGCGISGIFTVMWNVGLQNTTVLDILIKKYQIAQIPKKMSIFLI